VNYKLSESLAIKTVDDETFILDRATNKLHTFNALGSTLWRRLMAGDSCDKIVQAVVNEFDVDSLEAEKDVMEFLNKCEQERLLEISP
jgi:hypothetical protein